MPTSATTTTKRRPSYINLSNSNSMSANDVLSPRTPRSITKSRRSSVVAEHVQEVIIENTTRHNTQHHGPALLSDSTNSYFQDLAAHDDETTRQDTPTLMARASYDDLKGSLRRTRSSSLSSLLGPSAQILPSFDVHTLYKIRTTRTYKKLTHFFGESAPHDICIKEIRKEGLKAILESKSPLCYFLYHLLQEFSSENLFFFIELEQFESFSYTSPGQQLETAQHIYNTYLSRNSYFEVNLDDKVRRSVTEALENKDAQHCFDTAKRAVYALLESSYMRFQNTDTFEDMVNHCGELITFYDDEARLAAVNKLMSYVEQQQNRVYNTEGSNSMTATAFQSTTIRRHELIKSMIHEFCRSLVGIEISYNSSEGNQLTVSGTTGRHVGYSPLSNSASASTKK
ncbi:RGS domain-containing protein [Choanephora cucurbitarum]|nr:RGS domain-containing protein [Choanephora cucurbitarum]